MRSRLTSLLVGATLFVVLPGFATAGPLDVSEVFQIRGSGKLQVDGHTIPGSFDGELAVLPGGAVARLNYLRLALRPFSVTSGPFWDRKTDRFRCSSATTIAPVVGNLTPIGKLVFPAGAARMTATSFGARGAGGSCPGTGAYRRLVATNNDILQGWHDPVADVFRLAGTFRTSIGGHTMTIVISMEGEYTNRPPLAALGVVGPGIDLIQGGCPPLSGVNPPAAEANDPQGLRITLQSNSTDPDGAWRSSDIALASWHHWRGGWPGAPGATYDFLGLGRRVGPVLFELGQHHLMMLKVTDRAGAKDIAGCEFEVTDTTPPEITPPDPITIECSLPLGATPDSSAPLAAWLGEGTATDLTDPAPTRLATQIGGADIVGSTFFPLGVTTPVSFRYRDRHGNRSEGRSWVRVLPRLVVEFDLGLPPGRIIDPNFSWRPIIPRIRLRSSCGFLRWYLESIRSNGPEPIEKLIKGVSFGKEVSKFELMAAPVERKGGGYSDRTYELTFVVEDATGQKTRIVEKVVVAAEPQAKQKSGN